MGKGKRAREGKTIVMASKNWGTIGLFCTDEPFRVDDLCDFNTWRWVEHGACRGTDPDSWFQREQRTNSIALAAICAECVVRIECLEYALEHNESGWWGGLSHRDRKLLSAEAP